MAEFRLTHAPTQSPTKCLLCEEFAPPFIDTHMEIPGWGRVYFCAPREGKPGCVGQMAHLTGYVEETIPLRLKELVDELRLKVQEQQEEIDELRALDQIITATKKRMGRSLKESDEEEAVYIPQFKRGHISDAPSKPRG